jgi:hypothetical protein
MTLSNDIDFGGHIYQPINNDVSDANRKNIFFIIALSFHVQR